MPYCEAQLLTLLNVHVHDCIHISWDNQRQAQLAHPHDLLHELQPRPYGVLKQLPPVLSTPAYQECRGHPAIHAMARMSLLRLPAAVIITIGQWMQYSEVVS